MTREEALAALVEKLRKRVEGVTIKEGWMKGARPRWCREIDWFREELEAALALPADAPAAAPSDRERRVFSGEPLREFVCNELTQKIGRIAKTLNGGEYEGVIMHSLLPLVAKTAIDAVELASVHASTPTLTAEDVESMIRSALSFTDSQNPSQVSLSYARMAERGNAILAAKSQEGGDAITNEPANPRPLTQDRARTEPVKANECETPSAAWDRAVDACADAVETAYKRNMSGENWHERARNFVLTLRGKYEEPKP